MSHRWVLVSPGDGLLEQPTPSPCVRALGDTGKILTGWGRAPDDHGLGVGVRVEDDLGDVFEKVACEVAAVLHPRHGLLHQGLARPVDLPGDSQARPPKVAVDDAPTPSKTESRMMSRPRGRFVQTCPKPWRAPAPSSRRTKTMRV